VTNAPGSTGPVPLVRFAHGDDAAIVAFLVGSADAAMMAFRGGDVLHDEVPSVYFDPTNDGVIWLVAEVSGAVVGVLTMRVEAGTATVERVFVEPAARGHGAGDALVATASAEARRRGASRIDGWALPGDRETKNLYERNGLTARAIIASRDLTN